MLIGQLRSDIAGAGTDARGWLDMLDRCDAKFNDIRLDLVALLEDSPASPPGSLRDLRNWLERSGHHLRAMRRDIETALPWLPLLAAPVPGCEAVADRFAAVLDPAAGLTFWRTRA